MNDLLHRAAVCIAELLSINLVKLSPDWWQTRVMDRLSFQQQRVAAERRYSSLQQLDFAALLRVLDQNWYDLSRPLALPREARSWVKELQNVRNKWAHLSAKAVPPSECYRDADTLGRLLETLGADPETLQAIAAHKTASMAAMSHGSAQPLEPNASDLQVDSAAKTPAVSRMHLFQVGDLVALRSDPNVLLPVMEVLPGGAECRYRVFQNSAKATYYESQLQAPIIQEIDRPVLSARELHARLTALQIRSPSMANLFSLRSGRVQFVPYQYRPVLKLIRADRPRLLIADEVGVGKTIEAGLIIKELRARMDISSVLVICPKALVAERKWHTEMKRFDEQFTALDGALLRHCLQETHLEGEWPEQYAKAILPFSLFDSDLVFGAGGRHKKKDQGLLQLDPPPKFDLVIVDEAHHIRNTETFLHHGVRYFCDNAQAVVLMTATPVQLGSDDLFTLLNVLRPDLVIDRASFGQMAEPNPHINEAVRHCRTAQAGWQKEARDCLARVAQTEWGRMFIREAPAFQKAYDQLHETALDHADRVGLIRAIEELYTFSHLINRTRRRDIGEFTTRKPETLTIDFTPNQKKLHDGLLDVIARILTRCHGQQNVRFMMTTIRRQAASCLYGLAPFLSEILSGKLDRLEIMETSDSDQDTDLGFVAQIRADIEGLIALARNLETWDPKVEAFVQVLSGKNLLPNNKALVFSTFRHTLTYLEAHATRAGLRVGLVHGDIPDDDRSDLRRRFALPKDDANAIDILLSSEVGCEGLDFQFCDLLINYDLPWNPMRIEQRIGRIDRYGQKSETVAVVNLITPGTVDADIYQRCLWRVGVFHHAIGGSEDILGTITQELHDIAQSFTLSLEEQAARLQQLADNAIRVVREEQELESKQSELFGLKVPNQSWRDEIEAAETFWLSSSAIQHTVTMYLEQRLGSAIEHLLGEKPPKTLRLNQEARGILLQDFKQLPRSIEPISREWEKWLKGANPTIAVTFDQGAAVDNPRIVQLTVLHPLVRQAAHFLDITLPKYFTFTTQYAEVPNGLYHFVLYRWVKYGLRPDQTLVAISDEPRLEATLMALLRTADKPSVSPLPDAAVCDALDARHHSKWAQAQANHIAENRQLVEHSLHSLAVSHRARCSVLENQVQRATNEKIRLMKQSELARANSDFSRRIAELRRTMNTGDIRATAVVFGSISVTE